MTFGLPANDLAPGAGTAFGFLQRLIKENAIKSCWGVLLGGSAGTGCWLGAGRQLKMLDRGSQKYLAIDCASDGEYKLFWCKAFEQTGEGPQSFTHTRGIFHIIFVLYSMIQFRLDLTG